LRVKETNNKKSDAIPDDALEALARCLLPAIRSFYESEEGQREFAEWQSRNDIVNLPGRKAKSDKEIRLAG
jgi:hypothetical protein